MKTIRKKTPVLAFEEVYTDLDSAQTYEVLLGTQRLGHVSYEQAGGTVFIKDLFVMPEFSNFGVEIEILDALFASDDVHVISMVSSLAQAGIFQADGFVCDPSSVLLIKRK